MSKDFQTCPNCEESHDSSFDFCPHCGQKSDEDITIGNLFYNTITNYFSFDARFFKSFIPLLFKPGYLAREFVRGKRLQYLHPAQMYLFVSVIFFFLFSFIQREQASEIDKALKEDASIGTKQIVDSLDINKMDIPELDSISKDLAENPKKYGLTGEQGKNLDSVIKNKSNRNYGNFNVLEYNIEGRILDSLIAANATNEEILKEIGVKDDDSFFKRKLVTQVLKIYKNRDGGSIYSTLYQALPIAMFFLLPIFALLIFLFYIGKGGFAHHLVFSFYFFSFQFALFAIIVGVNLIWDIPDWIDWLLVFSTFFYFLFALRRYYQQGWFLTFIKGSALSFLFLSIVLPISFSLLLLYSFLFY